MKYQLRINAKDFAVEVGDIKAGAVQVTVNGTRYDVLIEKSAISSAPAESLGRGQGGEIQGGEVQGFRTAGETPAVQVVAPPSADPMSGAVIAPIPGLILEIKVHQGEPVSAGQVVATMEAMKMENSLTAPVSGTVKEIRVQKGTEVSSGEVIMRIG